MIKCELSPKYLKVTSTGLLYVVAQVQLSDPKRYEWIDQYPSQPKYNKAQIIHIILDMILWMNIERTFTHAGHFKLLYVPDWLAPIITLTDGALCLRSARLVTGSICTELNGGRWQTGNNTVRHMLLFSPLRLNTHRITTCLSIEIRISS